MSEVIKIKKGLTINLQGEADKVFSQVELPKTVAVKPTDFPFLTPKLTLKPGANVLAGDTLFYDKDRPAIKFASPVSGEVVDVIRGAKRKILEVRVLADSSINYQDHGSLNPASASKEDIKSKMLNGGVWAFLTERPFGGVANPEAEPRDIFISGFDTNPLAGDIDFMLHGLEEEVKTAVEALSKLTSGKVYIGVSANAGSGKVFDACKSIDNVVVKQFNGQHPAGNVGTQIHAIEPINKGEMVWTVNANNLPIIGKLFLEGKYDATRALCIAGPGIENPKYIRTIIGAPVKDLVANNVKSDANYRIISGSPLSGSTANDEFTLGHFEYQICALEEGDKPKFVATEGWMSPGFNRFSLSRTYPTWLIGKNKKFNLDTNLNGEHRAFVVTGQYEKVFPFDIYPVQLIKSIITNDVEMQENLGIYEVLPEDFAVCEFVCTSKIESQDILRKGLENLKAELG